MPERATAPFLDSLLATKLSSRPCAATGWRGRG
jgi:hypothetical protein